MIFDTNILVDAVGGDHPLRALCADLIARIGRGERRETTTIEAIQEFAHVFARRRTPAAAIDDAGSYIDLLRTHRPVETPIVPDADMFRRGPTRLGAEPVRRIRRCRSW